MNSTYKFRTDEKFDYNNFIRDKAREIVADSVKSFTRQGEKLTDAEIKALEERTAKDMTMHIYYARRISKKDLAAIRPKAKPAEKTEAAK